MTFTTIEPLETRTLFAAIRIMPLGDSITEGLNGQATYRYWLWHKLADAHFDVDFVGTQHGVFNGTPRFPDFDQDHQGEVGFRADLIADNVATWANSQRPDIVLLHIGTNDLLQGQSVSSTIDDIGRIIDSLRGVNPNVTVLLAKIIPSGFANLDANIQALDEQIPGLVSAKDTQQSRVLLVDQYSGFDPQADSADGLHPTESGEKKMADRWFDALAPELTVPPPPPPKPMEYLSDLPFQSARNALGPVERNKSNGGAATLDGRTEKLNGALFRHGLGVHGQADVRFDLNGEFKTFLASIGVDDEVGNHAGSVIFRVFVDYLKVFDSGPMLGRTATKSVIVDVTGAHNLRLLVVDRGDGNANDHADWADARVVRPDTPGAGPASGPMSLRAGAFQQTQPILPSVGPFDDNAGLWNSIRDLTDRFI
jgi:lysophospholipase L1-like esterase